MRKLELTLIIILLARNGELGSSVAREGLRLGVCYNDRLAMRVILQSASMSQLALFSLVFTYSVSLNFITICTGLYVS